MADYRASIQNSLASADGRVLFDCWIQRLDGENWVNVPNGHRTLSLPANSVLAITENDQLTSNQKRQQLAALFRTEAKNWGIDESDAANEDIIALIPGEDWPVNVSLDV